LALNEFFRKFASVTSTLVGSAWSFLVAVLVTVIWGVTGPLFDFPDTWQPVINTGTTIITFLMVFLIQNTQNRDAKAIHLKLDELVRAVKGARTGLVDLEEMSDAELENLQKEFARLREQHGADLQEAVTDIHEELAQRASEKQQAADKLCGPMARRR
jgi:low affinity Fe/Cu permease